MMLPDYLLLAVRMIRKQGVYFITTLTGLSIGIGCCLLIAIFVVDEFSYDRYHEDSGRIFRLATKITNSAFEGVAKVNGPWGIAASNEIPEVEAVTRFVIAGQQLLSNRDKRFYESAGFYADSTVFGMFSYPWIAGDKETALAEPDGIVLTESLVTRYFGGGSAIGKVIRVEDRDFVVTGVMRDIPSNSHFVFSYLLPMSALRHPQRDSWVQWNQFYTYMLLRETASPAHVALKMKDILKRNLPTEIAANYTPFLQPLTAIHLYSHLHREITPNSNINYIYIFTTIAILILAISCANFVNLATAQSIRRAREVGVRKVNGAARSQLMAQFLVESFAICICALFCGSVLAVIALPVFNELTGKNITMAYFSNPRIVVSMVMVTVLTALLAGSYPAFYQSGLRPALVLKGRWKPTRGGRLRKALVVSQFALSSMLIVGISVIVRQLGYIEDRDPGFTPEQIVTIPIQAEAARRESGVIRETLLQHPGVASISLSGNLPGGSDWGIPTIPEGFTADNAPSIRVMAVDAAFVRTYGLQVIAGRDFSDAVISDSAAYLINEEAARQLGWTDPLSKTISMPAVGRKPGPVIGVVRDFHFRSIHEKIGPILLMIPPAEWFTQYSIKIDERKTEDVLEFIAEKWKSFDPDHPFTYNFFDQIYSSLYNQERRLARIVGYFAAIGILLACMGLYSLASYTAAQRKKEIGIRKVNGASSREIVGMLSGQYMLLVALGFVIAVPCAWWVLDRWLRSFAYHANFDVALVLVSGLALMIVALATVAYNAFRAACANPAESLRAE